MTGETTHVPRRRRKLQNLLHTAILVIGMAGLAGVCAWLIWGGVGLVWAAAAVGFALLFTPTVPPRVLLRLYRARPLDGTGFPDGVALVAGLSRRAGLARQPGLYYLPSATLNAFTVGRPGDCAIAVSDGMLRALDFRELAGVLAHEVSHVANHDLRTMAVADAMSRVTGLLSYFGMVLLILNLPLVLAGAVTMPWPVVGLLIFAPTLMSLLQLALSRAREFDADLDAARLTGDPAGLARALAKIEHRQGRFWEEILLPGRRMPEPSLLRTHPPTEERVRRLLELKPPVAEPLAGPPAWGPPSGFAPIATRPRFRRSGLWY